MKFRAHSDFVLSGQIVAVSCHEISASQADLYYVVHTRMPHASNLKFETFND